MGDAPRVCEGCGGEIKRPGRADQRYHDAGCRMSAMRARAATSTSAVRRRPLRPQVESQIRELRRLADRINKLASDDRFRRTVTDADKVLVEELTARINRAVTN